MESSDKAGLRCRSPARRQTRSALQMERAVSTRGAEAFPGAGRARTEVDEMSPASPGVAKVKEERDILKKAAAYFAKELG